MALALNRCMCHSVLPLIVKHVELLQSCQNRVNLLDQLLHTIYRMSRAKALTKAQKEMISGCLVAVARYFTAQESLFSSSGIKHTVLHLNVFHFAFISAAFCDRSYYRASSKN